MKHLFPLLLAPLLLNAQIEYSGSIHPSNLYRISDGSEISLPFRLVDMELGYTWRDFDIKTRWAIETRWSDPQLTSDLREAYLAWYPSFGEVRLGKQIFAWGAADGNNPTDNLSAYDYYYLFLPGVDRKIGSLSIAVNAYLGNWQIEAVVIPEHQGNRLVLGEPDFPLFQSEDAFDPREFIVEVDAPLEFGVRLQTSIFESDVSLSYFKGHDRIFSLVGLDSRYADNPVTHFGYRSTDVLGLDFVSFIGGITVRGETAYFKTSNEYDKAWAVTFKPEVEYLQYVLQAEYTGFFDVSLVGQFIGNSILSVEGETLDQTTQQVISITKETFQPGMGTPFAMFVDQALMLTATGNLMDDRLKLSAFSFISLEETGYMFGLELEYSPIENWNIEISLNEFIGDGNSGSDNFFNRLEDFSHVFIGLKYSF